MSFFSWMFATGSSRHADCPKPAKRPKTTRLSLEQFEERSLLSSYTADTIMSPVPMTCASPAVCMHQPPPH